MDFDAIGHAFVLIVETAALVSPEPELHGSRADRWAIR
jgi:hypothetical protein